MLASLKAATLSHLLTPPLKAKYEICPLVNVYKIAYSFTALQCNLSFFMFIKQYDKHPNKRNNTLKKIYQLR